jgi:hypothetical protein
MSDPSDRGKAAMSDNERMIELLRIIERQRKDIAASMRHVGAQLKALKYQWRLHLASAKPGQLHDTRLHEAGGDDFTKRATAMKLYARIEKAVPQDDGSLKVYGVCSTEDVDDQGEIVRASAMRAAIPDYMRFPTVREMHHEVV